MSNPFEAYSGAQSRVAAFVREAGKVWSSDEWEVCQSEISGDTIVRLVHGGKRFEISIPNMAWEDAVFEKLWQLVNTAHDHFETPSSWMAL